jgi:rubrerythrin
MDRAIYFSFFIHLLFFWDRFYWYRMHVLDNKEVLEKSALSSRVKAFLKKIISSTEHHSRWLNTISMLEHIGSRKIHASQTGSAISEMILRHASEEARHAAFFKKAAIKLSPNNCKTYEKQYLLSGLSAFLYFQRLDASIHKALKAAQEKGEREKLLCYLYVTKMIEERAEGFYGDYQEILENSELPLSLQGIIKEEEGHLREMNETLAELDPNFQQRSEKFREMEKRLFLKFLAQLELSI